MRRQIKQLYKNLAIRTGNLADGKIPRKHHRTAESILILAFFIIVLLTIFDRPVLSATEQIFSLPNGGDLNSEFNATGYSDDSGNVLVSETEVQLATQADWWKESWNYKRQLTVYNYASETLDSFTPLQFTINTQDLVGGGKLQADCDDLRVVFDSGSNVLIEQPRDIQFAGGFDCSSSINTVVTFQSQANVASTASDANYYLYYGNASITAPSYHGESSLIFDGSDDRVNLSSNFNLGNYDEFSFSAWIKTQNPAADQTIYSNGHGVRIYISGSQFCTEVRGYRTGESVGWTPHCGGTITSDWHHVAFSFIDEQSIEVFVDGTSVNSDSSSIIYAHSGSTDDFLGHGSPSVSANPFEGQIDEVRFYNTSLNESYIQQTLYAGIDSSDNLWSNVIGYWRFDEGTGQTLADLSTSGFSGTLGADSAVSVDDPTWNVVSQSYSIDGKEALFVCPFNGKSTCVQGETPTTESGAIRYAQNSAGAFNGADAIGENSYVQGPSLPTVTALTVEGWYKITHVPSNYSGLYTGWGGFNINTFLNDGRVIVDYGDANSMSTSTSGLMNGSWHHVAYVFDGSEGRVYIDGNLVGSNSVNYSVVSRDFSISSRESGSARYKGAGGLVDEFRISDTARYTSNFTPSTTPFISDDNTLVLYHFDESGSDPSNLGMVIDASGNGNHGTFINGDYAQGVVGEDGGGAFESQFAQQTYASHTGIFTESATTNYIPNPSFENTDYDYSWDIQDVVGKQLVTNGTFDTDSDWVKGTGWAISSGSAIKTPGALGTLEQAGIVSSGATYEVKYEISNYNSGSINASLNDTNGISRTSNGSFIEYITAGAGTRGIAFKLDATFSGNIDNVSVREVTQYKPAVDFDGTDSIITVNDAAQIQDIFDGGGWVSAWINPRSDGENDLGTIYRKGAGDGHSIRLEAESAGKVKLRFFRYFSTSLGNWSTNNTVIDIGQPALVVISYDSSSTTNDPVVYIYQGGVLQTLTVGNGLTEDTAPVGSLSTDVGTNLYIGNRDSAATTFDGLIWDVRLGNSAISVGDVNTIIANQLVGSEVGYWRLNEGVNTTATDSINSNNGTIVNSIWGSTPASSLASFSENGDSRYLRYGNKSLQVSASSYDTNVTTSVNLGVTTNHTFSAYVFKPGDLVDSSIATLIFNDSEVTPTYTAEGGGWFRLSYTAAAVASPTNFGVKVKAGNSVYIDGLQLESNFGTYADGSLGTGYVWTGTPHASSSTRDVSILKYSNDGNIDVNKGTISVWAKFNEDYEGNRTIFSSNGVNFPGVTNGTIGIFSDFLGRPNFEIDTGIVENRIRGTALAKEEWAHYVLTWDNGVMNAYVNGVELGTGVNYTGTPSLAGRPDMSVGYGEIQNVGGFPGTISDLRIYNAAIDGNEANDIYYAGLATHRNGGEEIDKYVASATYTTPVLDLGAVADWSTTVGIDDFIGTFSANGGDITFQTATSPDNVVWSSFEPLITDGSGDIAIQSPTDRYLQVQALLTASSNQSQTPVLTDIDINYIPDATPPTSPTLLQVTPGTTNVLDTEQGALSYEDVMGSNDQFRDQLQDFSDWSVSTGDAKYIIVVQNDTNINAVGDTTSWGYLGNTGTDSTYVEVYQDLTLSTAGWNGSDPSSSTPISYEIINAWYNQATPSFTWPIAETEGGATDPGDGASGIGGYHIYFGTDDSAIPSVAASDKVFQTDAGTGNNTFTLGNALTTNGIYHLLIQTQDAAGNNQDSVTIWNPFIYHFDNVAPAKPVYVISDPSSWTDVDDFTFTWPAGIDNESGVWGYCYKIGSGTETCERKEDLQSGSDYQKQLIGVAQDGINVFQVRTLDFAGNHSEYTQTSFYYNSQTASAPESVTAFYQSDNSLCNNSLNCWYFTWAPPLDFSGNIVRYYYSVNELPTESSPYVDGNTTTAPSFSAGTRQGTNWFYVTAEDEVGVKFDVVGSVSFTVDTGTAPGIPDGILITDSSNRDDEDWALTLQWSEPSETGDGIDRYNVYRSENGIDFTEIAETSSSGFLDSDLSNENTYYYKVSAEDNAANEGGQSSPASAQPTGKFSSPPTFGGVPVATTTAHTATIEWSTSRPSDSYVEYGLTPDYELGRVGDSELVTSHKVVLRGLASESAFHYRIQSVDDGAARTYSPEAGYSDDYTFATLKAPDITEVRISDITLTSATISWKTTTISSSEVLYGPSIEYGNSVSEESSSLTTNHTIRLVGLQSGTLYNFKIVGSDSDGVEIFSDNYVFQTIAYPSLSNIRLEKGELDNNFGAFVTWESNVPTSSVTKYYPKDDPDNFQELFAAEFTTEHELFLNDLLDNTLYLVEVSGLDVFGNLSIGTVQEFTTDIDTRPPKILNLTVETASQGLGREGKGQIIVSWETNEPATSQVEFNVGSGSGDNYSNSSVEDSGLSTSHVVVLSDLNPGTPYRLRAVSKDAAGNVAYSDGYVTNTRIPQDSAIDLIINSLRGNFGWLF